MVDIEFARRFADDWVETWNRRDINTVMTFYRDDFELTSPFIRTPGKTLQGKAVIRAYWEKGLEMIPDLFMELNYVTVGVNMVSLCYQTAGDRTAIETFFFDADGKISREIVGYDI